MLKLLLLDATGNDATAIASAAHESGVEVYAAAQTGSQRKPDRRLDTVVRERIEVDFGNSEAAVKDLTQWAAARGIDGLTTANEFLTPIVASACSRLSVPGNSETYALAARNKIDMSRRFADCGVSAPRTFVAGCAQDVADLVSSGAVKYPFVVKPADGAGSRGVRIVFEEDSIPDAFDHASGQSAIAPFGMAADTRTVVQNYVEGAEYSVESVTQSGLTSHLCITEKFTTTGNSRIDTGQSVPAILAPGVEERIFEEVGRAVAAVGIENGVSHTEVKITPDGGCAIIEIGARIAGGRIPILVEAALGVDLWKCCVDAALGVPAAVTRTRSRFAALRYLAVPRAGRLAGIENLPTVSDSVPIVSADRMPGDQLTGPDSSKGRVGYFVVTGDGAAAANRHADEILARIRVMMAPGS